MTEQRRLGVLIVQMASLVLRPDLVREGSTRASDLTPSADLRAMLQRVHGAEALASFVVPDDYAAFVREIGCGLRSTDGTWRVFDWPTATSATLADYELFVASESAPAWEIADSLSNFREAGIWLLVGDWHRHTHFLCCDRRRAQFGQVYDLNDGSPATGMVYDSVWPSFRDYVA